MLLTGTFCSAALAGCGSRAVVVEPDAADDAGRVVAVGAAIDEVLVWMEPYGDGRPLLAGGFRNPDLAVKQWSVDQGVLSASYSISTDEIVGLTFHCSDWRQPRGERMYFDFEVVRFDPEAGELLIRTDTPGGDEG
ncbi:MAG: hypothetical protein AAGA25_01430 [Planctomycetota bacterium]